nr:MAG TPA: hypothetical protein [Caudoviricetes sp.]
MPLLCWFSQDKLNKTAGAIPQHYPKCSCTELDIS